MHEKIKLSKLVEEIQESIQTRFEGEIFWVSAQISNLKKQDTNRRCYLTLVEFADGVKIAELRAVFWANYYSELEKFEKLTKQEFKEGLELICKVKVRFHKVYGLNLDIMQIDLEHTLGELELKRQETLEKLVKENPKTIQLYDGVFRTYNKQLPLPVVIENIALITASNSDGQRDFLQELTKNKHKYSFSIKEYLIQIQGDGTQKRIIEELEKIENDKNRFDIVAIVRGGGSQTDFIPFDDYELSKYVANFPVPIITGIGHDRNQSIVDLMVREQKTPTKVATLIVEHNFDFENKLIETSSALFALVNEMIRDAKEELIAAKQIVKLSSPQAILNRGFTIITSEDKIITDPNKIKLNSILQILFKNETIHSKVIKKTKNEKRINLQ